MTIGFMKRIVTFEVVMRFFFSKPPNIMHLSNHIAAWATRHSRHAIFLIICIEFVNVITGILVGSAILNSLPPWKLMLLVLGVIVVKVCLKRFAQLRLLDLVSQSRFSFQKQVLTGLFCLNLFSYTLAGGILGHMVVYPEASSSLYGSMTTINSGSEVSSNERKMTLREKIRQNYRKRTQENSTNRGLLRVGYFMIFLGGIFLSALGASLACNLACAGYGIPAVLVFLLSIGVIAGAFYFFGRTVDKNMKPYQEMNNKDLKRERRRYLRTLAGTTIMLLVLMLSSIGL